MQVSLYRTLQKSALLLITFLFKKFCQFMYLENDPLKIKVNCNTVPKHSTDGQTWKVGDKGKSLVKRTLRVNKIWGYIGKINEMFKCVCKTEKASEQETNRKKCCGIFVCLRERKGEEREGEEGNWFQSVKIILCWVLVLVKNYGRGLRLAVEGKYKDPRLLEWKSRKLKTQIGSWETSTWGWHLHSPSCMLGTSSLPGLQSPPSPHAPFLLAYL